MSHDDVAAAIGAASIAFEVDPALLPVLMLQLRAWVNWRYELRNGKVTKVPCQPDGQPASTTDPKTWSSLEAVLSPSVPVDGIGFVFTGECGSDGLCIGGIDLDDLKKRRDDEPDDSAMLARKERAARIVREARSCGTYMEVSPSGGGIHILGRIRPLVRGIKRDSVEIYTSARYFTVTTKQASGNLTDIVDLAESVVREIAPDYPAGFADHAPSPPSMRCGPVRWNDLPRKVQQTINSWLTGGRERDRAARQRLWAGRLQHHNGDHSAADLSFISQMIRRGLSADEADLALRASGLMRPKWDAKRGTMTYGDRTLAVVTMTPRRPSTGG